MITLLEILDKYWVVISAFFGGVGFLFGKKERKVNLQDKIQKLNADSIDYIRSDFEKRIESLKQHIKEKTTITDGLIKELKASNDELEAVVRNQRKIIENQKSLSDKQANYINKLETEIKQFKNVKTTTINP